MNVFSFTRFGRGLVAASNNQIKSERSSTQKLAALHRIAGFARSGRCLPRAFGDGGGGNARSKITAVAERIHLDAEYCARGEGRRRNSLLRQIGRAHV